MSGGIFMSRINIAIVGVSNCASALLQGLEMYKVSPENTIGLIDYNLGGYTPADVNVVAAFDVDKRKVGKGLKEAVFAKPNCAKVFYEKLPDYPVKVQMGEVLDGVSDHMTDESQDKNFLIADEKPCDVVKVLKESGADILINYLPVGSEKAARFYAEACLEANVGFINAMPVFIASDEEWAKKFQDKNIPIIGDDVKSQVGATIIHRTLTKLFENRGVSVDRTYQLNFGGNTDFMNMLNRNRLESKKKSKTQSVQSELDGKVVSGFYLGALLKVIYLVQAFVRSEKQLVVVDIFRSSYERFQRIQFKNMVGHHQYKFFTLLVFLEEGMGRHTIAQLPVGIVQIFNLYPESVPVSQMILNLIVITTGDNYEFIYSTLAKGQNITLYEG
jgi:myo-inositol-1-phosphate synthase